MRAQEPVIWPPLALFDASNLSTFSAFQIVHVPQNSDTTRKQMLKPTWNKSLKANFLTTGTPTFCPPNF